MKTRNITWGLFFILMAAFIMLSALDVFGDISVWTCVFAGFCVMWFINGLMKLSFGNMLFPVAFLAILFDETLGIEKLTPWPVLFAALFGTIGFNMIFGSVKKRRVMAQYKAGEGVNTVDDTKQSDKKFMSGVAFGSAVKYVKCQHLEFANIETSFGNTTVYFDTAKLNSEQATVKVSSSFGKTTLYIPKDWNVNVNVEKSFGSILEKGECTPEGINRLMVVGNVSFGNLEIIYV